MTLGELLGIVEQRPRTRTALTPEQEMQFEAWRERYAPKDSGMDYDLAGAFLAGLRPDPQSGHWPDTFKRPNHPTFSIESQYASEYPELAGHWHDETYHRPNYVETMEEQEPRGTGDTLRDILALLDRRQR